MCQLVLHPSAPILLFASLSPYMFLRQLLYANRVARRIYAVTAAEASRRAESDLLQIPDAPVVELVEAPRLVEGPYR